ncbi:thiamine-phosphate kinase [[Mycobacterium] burgundiense]|uniref:Thiamine-monophosphate kinase n=1 Tax=[Mycobacterium] burgundiense TaxID=3064286 RepID=A0ABM9LY45_9MYCO|nr:thiamine-phosphate kinase [Mycolicibacterium sp. MU0053]CAJ1506658.1 thiamine-phosphate kinase [Mycolicibacterium sp. MU0053]
MTDDDRTLREVGEFPVIDRLVAGRRQPDSVLIGPGDDAAVIAVPDARMVISTDMLVQDRHFRLDWSAPHDVGRKAIAQNAADIEAMGARSVGFVVGIGAPGDTPARLVQQLSDGLWDEAQRCGGAGIVGGDLVSSPVWVVSVTAFGELGGRTAVTRAGARPGDTVAVAGQLGRSAAGYALLAAGAPGFDDLCGRHLVPQPPYGQGRAAAAGGARAMTDVSDGLLADLGHLATASGVRIEVAAQGLQPDLEALAAAADRLGIDAAAWVLGGGEDHALVACFPGELPPGWRSIGAVSAAADGPDVLVDGRRWTGSAGWESFN